MVLYTQRYSVSFTFEKGVYMFEVIFGLVALGGIVFSLYVVKYFCGESSEQ